MAIWRVENQTIKIIFDHVNSNMKSQINSNWEFSYTMLKNLLESSFQGLQDIF
jgi:hypothetical protein